MLTVDQCRRVLKKALTPRRYNHSLAVADEAVRLATKYGCDTSEAYYAGLMHDIAKDMKGSEQLALLFAAGVELSPVERAAPKLWHAMAGSVLLRDKYDFPESIVLAVRYHTTARAGMSLLEKTLYLADFTSRDRDYDGVEDMRRAVDVSLKFAMEEALAFTINDLCGKRGPIHPDTVAAYNETMLRRSAKGESDG